MVSKKLLGIAVAGAFTLGGCGLIELADAIEGAVQDAAAQVKKEVTAQNVKGSLNGIGAAMRGISALEDVGGGANGAPGLLAQAAATEQCTGGGSVTMDESEDGNSVSLTADNCTEQEADGSSWFVHGTLSMQASGDPESGNMTISYTANLEMTTKDAAGNVVESFSFNNLSMEIVTVVNQTAGTFSYTYTANGGMTGTEGGETNTIDFTNFTLALAADGEMTSASYSIDGGMSFSLADAACTDGAFEFSTSTPLSITENADCPTAGVITVNGVTYTFDGDSITAASGDQSETFSCDEVVGDDMCDLGEDNSTENNGGAEYPAEETPTTL